jgi:hypothetical protein
MNVFVLNTGRCGSTTFAAACAHVTNFTVAHESRVGALGAARFDYPRRHIEVDNRLSWFLGRLEQRWGQEAFYVHLTRDVEATARSFSARYSRGIMLAYRTAILPRLPKDAEPVEHEELLHAEPAVVVEERRQEEHLVANDRVERDARVPQRAALDAQRVPQLLLGELRA